jgi:hypothetical protein
LWLLHEEEAPLGLESWNTRRKIEGGVFGVLNQPKMMSF